MNSIVACYLAIKGTNMYTLSIKIDPSHQISFEMLIYRVALDGQVVIILGEQ